MVEQTFVLQHMIIPKFFVMTTRFNNNTWNENRVYCNKIKVNTAYCAPIPITSKIPPDVNIGILEMNNDLNRITGIGLIKNKLYQSLYIYDDGNYNRNTYIGKRRIDRVDMNEEEEKIMVLLDSLCFKGRGHLKRGQGITSFPVKMLYDSYKENILIVEEIRKMFNNRLKEK